MMKKLQAPIRDKGEKYYMRRAMYHARQAEKEGEVPVGAVIVLDGHIIASGRNRREKSQNALCHAEIEAIDKACRKIGSWRLCDCDLYVTLEPCPMCAGGIINSRIRRVVIGAMDKRFGCFGSIADMSEMPFNHKPEIVRGVLSQECSKMLSEFFVQLRIQKSEKKKGTLCE